MFYFWFNVALELSIRNRELQYKRILPEMNTFEEKLALEIVALKRNLFIIFTGVLHFA
jgi:hypothetical protein